MRSILVLLLLLAASTGQAAITVVAEYRFGESDPGALPNTPGANPSLPSVGSNPLTRNGTPAYSGITPRVVPSALSMAFNAGSDRYSGAIVSTATDNFGVEAWVKSNGSVALNATLVYNGNTGNSGWGLFRAGNEYGFLYGGVVLDGVVPISTQWTHLALVRDGGTNRFFVNGVQQVAAGGAPNPPVGNFLVGGNPLVATEGFDGLIDEVRVFTFEPGQFNVLDLNFGELPPAVSVGSPLTLLLLAGLLLAAGGLALGRRLG